MAWWREERKRESKTEERRERLRKGEGGRKKEGEKTSADKARSLSGMQRTRQST